jgi:hypothetical protein
MKLQILFNNFNMNKLKKKVIILNLLNLYNKFNYIIFFNNNNINLNNYYCFNKEIFNINLKLKVFNNLLEFTQFILSLEENIKIYFYFKYRFSNFLYKFQIVELQNFYINSIYVYVLIYNLIFKCILLLYYFIIVVIKVIK